MVRGADLYRCTQVAWTLGMHVNIEGRLRNPVASFSCQQGGRGSMVSCYLQLSMS
jgi:hypothetical protein